jgi:hypothetical protein
MKISNDPNLKNYFKIYSKILSIIIRAAKKLHYDKLISNFNNKIKATWNIIKTITGKSTNNIEVQLLNIKGKITDNYHLIADSLNNYFLTIVGKINSNNAKSDHFIEFDIDKHPSYLLQVFPTPFPEIKFKLTSTKEIENIIKSLKRKNSNGYDEISVNILKTSAPTISSPFTYICNGLF